MKLVRRATPIFLAGLLGLFGAAACGGDDDEDGGASDSSDDGDDGDDGDDDGDDGDDGDDDGGEPDAGGPTIVRRGTIAITETNITNVQDVSPTSGAVVSISFLDTETATVAPVKGLDTPVERCEVFVYDVAADEAEPTAVDEGPITVTGTANGDFTCAFSADQGEYLCQSTDAATAGGVASNAMGAAFDGESGGLSGLNNVNAVLNQAAVVGSQMLLEGFGDESLDGQLFGVVARVQASSVDLFTPGQVPDTLTAPPTATFTTFIGAGPIPNPGGAYNFMTDASEVAISSEGTELVPAVEGTYTAEGEGFELVDDPENGFFLPHQLPTVAGKDPVRFGCAAEGCGLAGSGGDVTSIVINGRTTDGELLPPEEDPAGTDMPEPVGSFATFTCGFVAAPGQDAQAEISAEALAAILGTSPTRIQTSVIRSQTVLDATAGSGTAETRVIIGHSQTGFTTVEAAPPKVARPTK
jgi:hypothetical protein